MSDPETPAPVPAAASAARPDAPAPARSVPPGAERPSPAPALAASLAAPAATAATAAVAAERVGAEIAAARRYAEAARSPATLRAYASDWRRFSAWCAARGLAPLPADPRAVAVFLSAEATLGAAPPTVGRRLAAIGLFHRRAGFAAPQAQDGAVADVLAGIRRSHGIAPAKKRAADADLLRDLLRTIAGDDLRSVRDRALLAFGMAGAFRRAELVALRLADVERVEEGLRVTIRRGKTDQEAAGAVIAIPDGRRLQPKRLLETWIDRAGLIDGFLFRRLAVSRVADSRAAGTELVVTPASVVTPCPMSDRAVARLVQRCAAAAGYDPAEFAGHSLRAGFLTAAARAGASVFKMREVSRHKSMQVLADYVRDAELFQNHAGEGFL